MRKIMLAFVMAACAAGAAHGQTVDSTGSTPPPRWRFLMGSFQPVASDPEATHNGLALGLGTEQAWGESTRFGLEALMYGTGYVTPAGITCGAFCTVNSTMSLSVVGVNGNLSYVARLGAMAFEVGAGAGLYWSKMTASASTFGLPGKNDQTSLGLGADVRAGVTVDLGVNQTLGIHFRRLNLDASFGPLSNNRNMPVGGAMALVSYTMQR